MRKWASALLSASMVLAMPVNAFATGVETNSKVHVNVDGSGKIHANIKEVNADGSVKVHANIKVDADGNVVLDPEVVLSQLKLLINGAVGNVWDSVQKMPFQDEATGLKGYCRLMWDSGNLYVLVEIEGAVKLWEQGKKPVLLSLFYNGDEQGDDNDSKEGWLALTYPGLQVVHGGHENSLKVNKLVKAVSVNGDNVNIELRIPWERKDGMALNTDCALGLFLKLKELETVKPDVNGQITVPVLTEEQILKLKPSLLPILPLVTLDRLIVTAPDNNGSNGNTGGTGSGSTGSGSTGSGGTGSGSTGNGSTGSGGVSDEGNGGTAVGGVSDEGSGVIPSDMPKTGGGGASEWTD